MGREMAVNLNLTSFPSARLDSIVSKSREFSIPKLGSFRKDHLCMYETWGRKRPSVKACCFNLPQEPILKEALKEPVAFVGGMFAGILRLDLNEDPLKEWVSRTVESSGITDEEVGADGLKPEDEEAPQEIEIE